MFLEIKGITKHFGDGESRVNVLKGIDVSMEKGEICVLLGPSGSGKSTLLNILGGIDQADDGYIAIDGAGCPIISNSLPAIFMPTPKLNDLVAG